MKIFLGVSVFLLINSWNEYTHEIPTTGFWAMEGNLLTHIFIESEDSLSGPEIFELRDDQGITIWFGRYIFKDVCISGECKMLKIWLFWDGAGNYLGFQLPSNEDLTKSDHEKFLPVDYEKLNDILSDTSSVLKTLEQEDLIIIPEGVDLLAAYKVDGVSAATQPSLAEVVVEDAVYTCYTLWHTVYGPVKDEISNMVRKRISREYLNVMLESGKSKYVISAIQNIATHPEFHEEFWQRILLLIKSKDMLVADQALSYFNKELLQDEIIQTSLVQIIQESDVSFRYKILWKLMEMGEVHDQTIIELFHVFTEEPQNMIFFNLCLKLVTPQQFKESERISELILTLADDEIYAVRNSTQKFLKKIGYFEQ